MCVCVLEYSTCLENFKAVHDSNGSCRMKPHNPGKDIAAFKLAHTRATFIPQAARWHLFGIEALHNSYGNFILLP